MRFPRLFREKKYWLRIFLWIACVILLIVCSFSALIYYSVERKVFQGEYENSQKILSQMKYNIDYLDSTIRNLTLSTYSNNEIKALMYLKEDETYDHLSTINKLNSTIIANNPFLHSIYIYNNYKNVYYSTFGDLFHKDAELDQALRSYDRIPTLKAIVRKLKVSDGTDPNYMTVLSYIMYENVDSRNGMDGAVILNIKLDWLVNNIRALNGTDSGASSFLYILDSSKRLIETEPPGPVASNPFAVQIRESYMQSVAGQSATAGAASGFLTKKVQGEKYIISYIHLENTGWTLLEARPYKEAYANLKQLLDTILLITGAVFIGALLLTLSVTRGIYSPVRRLMEQTSMGGSAQDLTLRSGARDEFAYLMEVYRQSKEQLYEYHLEKNNNTIIMKLYFLKKLLVDSFGMSVAEADDVLKQLGDTLSRKKPFIVGVLRIDDYKLFMRRSLAERELLRFAIANVTAEVLSKAFVAQTVDMKDDSFTILLNSDDRKDAEQQVALLLAEAQGYIQRHYGMTFSAAVSEPVAEYTVIAAAYSHAFANSAYRYVYGPMSVMTQSMIDERTGDADIEQTMETESRFIETFKKGDPAKTEEKFRELFRQIRRLEYTDIMLVGMQVVHHLKKAIYEMNRTRKEPINIPKRLLNRELYEEETIERFEQNLLEAIGAIGPEGNEGAIEGNRVAADTIKEIIDNNYFDSGLSATGISDMLRLSAYKLSKIAKEHFGMSIPEYINQVRLAKAVEWMENSKLSIQDIMRRVGIENESYFYKLFKANFGMTPREYITKKREQ
ncbi:helix-turn-helix domain-containing protein [Cohnella herbarum]|uniref:AraC family transcriptional regulator n=1 Tax=Cohnella herbarum TaxID=2728023 RepID=A0A7Z2ZLS6_9BACL|nr:helix-turn-helix domain-containing protein [Cohnella herbarum]QJD84606.1 AraC family transcriptional regulator [Cohnella herbarum]